MTMISDFLKKDPVRTCPSGEQKDSRKAKAFRRAALTVLLAAGMTLPGFARTAEAAVPQKPAAELTAAYTQAYSVTEKGDTLLSYRSSGTPAGKKRIEGLVNLVAQSKTGLSVLKQVEKHDCRIEMMRGMGNNLGLFVADQNAIFLNEAAPDSLLASTLVHEATHAQQVHNSGYNLDFHLNAETLITLGRAMEADASRSEVQASFELYEQGHESVWNGVKEQKPDMALAFLRAKTEHPSEPDSVAKKTMLSYYQDRDYLEQYEMTYTRGICLTGARVPVEDLGSVFQVSIPADSIVSRICVEDGRKYMGTDGTALKDSTTYFVHDHIYHSLNFAAEYTEYRQMKADSTLTEPRFKGDRSFESFYILHGDGRFEKPKAVEASEKEAVKTPEKAPGKEAAVSFAGAVKRVSLAGGR